MKDIFYANEPIIKQYQGNPPPPDPAFVMSLSNEVYSGSNLYAIQKMFDGEFSFDIYYESASAKQKLDGAYIIFVHLRARLTPL
jgi:mannosyl-oligosaccharide glucosidase